MQSIAILILTFFLMFVYRKFHPSLQLVEAGAELAKRIRVALLTIIMALSVTFGYLFPVEVGRGIQHLQQQQYQLQSDRTEYRIAAEQVHVARMIELFGNSDRYLTYLNSTKSSKSPL